MNDIKNFELMTKIGTGAYGVVYRAMHKSSQKLYAIKLVDKK